MAAAEDLSIWTETVDEMCAVLRPVQRVRVSEFAVRLIALSDDELEAECCRWIYNSSIMADSRRPVPDHALHELAANEVRRRDPGMALYERAQKLVM